MTSFRSATHEVLINVILRHYRCCDEVVNKYVKTAQRDSSKPCWNASHWSTLQFESPVAVPSPRGGFGGLIPPNKAPSPLKLKYKTLKINIIFAFKPPCTNVEAPYWRLSGDGSDQSSMHIFVMLRKQQLRFTFFSEAIAEVNKTNLWRTLRANNILVSRLRRKLTRSLPSTNSNRRKGGLTSSSFQAVVAIKACVNSSIDCCYINAAYQHSLYIEAV